MAKRGENIYKRKDGRWEGRYIKGRTPEGKAIYCSVYASGLSEVKDKLFSSKSSLRERLGNAFAGSFTDWADLWLAGTAQVRVKASTYASYRNKLDKHILPTLGMRPLADVCRADIQVLIDALVQKGLAPSSIQVIFRVMNAAFEHAVSEDELTSNPCCRVVLPTASRAEVRALSLVEQRMLEEKALTSPGNEAIIIALYTGMRIGEISALLWKDVDFGENLIRVQATLQRLGGCGKEGARTGILIGPPKSSRSERDIPLGPHLAGLLREWKARTTGDYVVECKGSFAEPRVISYRFRQIARAAGIEGTTFHALRHTFATRLIERGSDIVCVSRLLGHTSVKLTLDTYADATFAGKSEAMCSLDTLLGQNENESKGCPSRADKQFILDALARILEETLPQAG